MAPNRVRAFAAVCCNGVAAGTMDSRKGNAIVTPAPVRNVRRDRCFLVMNAIFSLLRFSLHFLLKRVALDDSEYKRRELVIVLSGLSNDRTNRRHVVVLHRAANRVSQKLLRCRSDEH